MSDKSNKSNKNLLIAGGGTGGHICPGIALYEEFKKHNTGVIFLVAKRDKRFSLLNEIASGDLYFYRAPVFTKNIIKFPFFIISFLLSLIKANSIIKKMNICTVIGMGGYVSAPVLLAAKLKKIPIYLCEQNAVPGRVTRLFEKYSRRIYATFKASGDYFKYKEKFFHAGNPIRKKVINDINRDKAKKAFNLDHSKKIILVIGGSQGSQKINELIFNIKKDYPEDFKDVGVIWSTGSFTYKMFKELVHNEMAEGSIYLSPNLDRVGLAYRASDIAISRSGAGVMMELAAFGVPSILIPYPYAAMNHQDKNADVFVKEGAAIKIKEGETAPGKVAPVLIDLLNNKRLLQKMSDRASSVSKKKASEVIAKDIIQDIGLI